MRRLGRGGPRYARPLLRLISGAGVRSLNDFIGGHMPVVREKTRKVLGKLNKRPLPVGGVKIREAFKALLEEKEFNAIRPPRSPGNRASTKPSSISILAISVGLLHQVLRDYLDEYLGHMESELKGIKGTFNKLKKIVWSQMNLYETKRVLAKILLLEVRNYPGYFESESYAEVRRYSRIVTETLRKE